MTRALSFRFTLIGLFALLIGCSEYEFKLNDRAVYTPRPLFSDYHIADQALEDCVHQTILDKRATRAEHVTRLVCTNAGIVSVEGIGGLSHLEEVNLASNLIEQVEPLSELSQLRRLDISHNAVASVEALAGLAHLERLNLTGNPALACTEAEKLQDNLGAAVELPKHCQ